MQTESDSQSLKEAFEKLKGYAEVINENDLKKQDLFQTLSQNISETNKFYEQASNSIRRRVDHDSFLRKALVVDPLPPLAKAEYMAEEYKRKISVPTLYQRFCVKNTNEDASFYNRADRLVQKAIQKIIKSETQILLYLFAVCTNNRLIIDCRNESHSIKVAIQKMREAIYNAGLQFDLPKDHSIAISHFFINFLDFAELTKDVATNKEKQEYMDYNRICNCSFNASQLVPRGRIYGIPDPEYLGVMPIVQDITVTKIDSEFMFLEGAYEHGYGIIIPEFVFAADI